MISAINWQRAIALVTAQNKPWVLATVLGTRGSSPRNAGTKMVVTANEYFDTIGGGQFEYRVIERAREMISQSPNRDTQTIHNFPLSAKAKQCCGGSITIMLESFTGTKTPLYLFGAGHVAHALMPILCQMDLQINWVDNREELFPRLELRDERVNYLLLDDPSSICSKLPAGALALVMTHDHSLDYRITSALLDHSDLAYIGLIGSKTKSLRFRKRLLGDAFSVDTIKSIRCPVGLESIPGKKPIEIAVSIAAQLVQFTNEMNTDSNSRHSDSTNIARTGLSWQQLREDFGGSASIDDESIKL